MLHSLYNQNFIKFVSHGKREFKGSVSFNVATEQVTITIHVEKVNISIQFISDHMSLKVRGNSMLCSSWVL